MKMQFNARLFSKKYNETQAKFLPLLEQSLCPYGFILTATNDGMNVCARNDRYFTLEWQWFSVNVKKDELLSLPRLSF